MFQGMSICLYTKQREKINSLENGEVVMISLTLLFLYCLHQGVLDGKFDDLPEQSFYMVGGIEEVVQKAEKLSKLS